MIVDDGGDATMMIHGLAMLKIIMPSHWLLGSTRRMREIEPNDIF